MSTDAIKAVIDYFQPIDPRNLRAYVSNSIREAILDGVLKPGDAVNHTHMAESLGISRGPVREALAQLEEEGLVRTIANKGTFVTDVTLEFIDELYSLRVVLETFSIRRTVENIDEDGLVEMREALAAMRDVGKDASLKQSLDRDMKFHFLIYKHSRHKLILQMWKSLEMGTRRLLAIGHSAYTNPADILGTHPDVLAAIEARDADLASRLLESHILESAKAVRQSWIASRPAVSPEGD